ncbi:MAG: glycosyltransferase family 2 protein [Anaerolineales bacterium]|nr:glycosyltransferase family 2 protein [Anaerolineales bacterium]
MKNEPLFVSAIIPFYNAQDYIAEAITSVRRQTFSNLEIIAIDDGSTDQSAELVKSLGDDIRYAYQPNQGPSAARNHGLRLARGNVIAFLDADDYWPVNKLEIQLDYMRKNPETEIVLGRIQHFGLFTAAEEKILYESPDKTLVYVNLGSGIFRKNIFDRVGLFDESMRNYEDHDWFLRVREKQVKISILKDVTLYYRLHEYNTSRINKEPGTTILQVLKKSLDRRRQDPSIPPLLDRFFDYNAG